ncbi:MAG: hypothetical protein JWM27_967 [Gemmatimonadetes bacterium]|nr:hypothetical protein [Gemmatimonadota bacterium]
MIRANLRRAAFLAALLLPLAGPTPAAGQAIFTRPWLAWRTLHTEHFDVHYPAEMSAWTLEMASRLEGTWTSVGALVGSTPGKRVTVVVEDPSVQANGSAYPLLDRPSIVLWPTPPDPRSVLSNHRGFAEQVEVHEFAHIAHLTRPSRNPRERLLFALLPARFGPVSRRSPRWVAEGYATYIEGRVTGSGRPHGAARAATLREWALEGKLPTYAQMSSSAAFQGGSMAYLMGSAFLEWLVDQKGEQSLVNLWRRMSARQERTFAEAFAGVYGGYPQDLYGRFTVDVTEKALAARRALAAAGIEAGEPVQRLGWGTGDPAVSPDGKHLAVVLRGAPGVPVRVVVWNARDEPEDSASVRARRRMLERDPQDVPAIEWKPRTRRALATLLPSAGRGHDEPRFLPDGRSLLVTRYVPTADGALRPDLFVWTWTGRQRLRRVTHGAAILSADPTPDGQAAVGVRCRAGICDLVRIGLADGAVTTIAAGSPMRVFDRPRVSPDGRSAAVAVHSGDRWRAAVVALATGEVRFVDPDDGASRYDVAWADAGTLVETSERGGVANLERLSLADGSLRPLTRVTGGAFAPEPGPAGREVLFLSLHSGGYDLNRIRPDSSAVREVVALSPALAPAAPPAPVHADTLPRNGYSPPAPYGLGPRRLRILPGGAADADGANVALEVATLDPIGRLAVAARGVYGQPAAERGGALAFAWNGRRPSLSGNLAFSRREPSHGRILSNGQDADLWGAGVWGEQPVFGGSTSQRLRAGAFAGALQRRGEERAGRYLAFAEYAAAAAHTRGGGSTSTSLALHGSTGSTDGQGWTRGLATLTMAAAGGGLSFRGQATYGQVSADAPAWERFAVGGVESSLNEGWEVSQRIAMPGLPLGSLGGSKVLVLRGSTRLGPLTPYCWTASADGGFDRWHRVIGAEAGTDVPATGLLSLPAVRIRAGVAYSLDDPWRHRTRAYASVAYRP